MSLIAYYRHLGKGKFKQITAEDVKKLKEINLTSAVLIIDRIMFINNFNTAFSVAEVKQTLDFVDKLKEKRNEGKPTNSSSTTRI
jgi:hypothetical protein